VTNIGKALSGALAGAVFGLLVGVAPADPVPQTGAQEAPLQEVQKPSFDYMDNFLSRSTNPLGIKEDPAARKMLGQGSVPWAIRAGSRHVLD
jgi:hypothetical protein